MRNKRTWHPDFLKYMKFIVNHPNYRGIPFLYKKNGEISWIAARSSEIGLARLKWWDQQREKLGIPKDGAWISKTAKAIHPTGHKPCQICGRTKKLDYVYPNKKGGLSPGAMSNAPDRLDGYHSYNLCCRSESDRGRHKSNLLRYGEDRRAYENWSDGDWKAASWLMKEFQKHGVSADHLGPISLGFRHRPSFRPLSKAANSARNNRMTLGDVKVLIEEEKNQEVISEHSRALWDLIKFRVYTESDALLVSKLMRENMHYVLSIFSVIAAKGYKNFLIRNFLHPEYANFSIKFNEFDPNTGYYREMIKAEGNKKQYKNNADRYIRISFESLLKYSSKTNRNLKDWPISEIKKRLDLLLNYLKANREKESLKKLQNIFKVIAIRLARKLNN